MKYINKDSGKVWLSNEEVNIAQSKRLYYTLCIILYLPRASTPTIISGSSSDYYCRNTLLSMSDIWDFLRTGKNTRCGKFRKSCIVQKISSIFAKQMSLPGEPQGSILGGRFQFYSSLIPTRPAMSAVRPSSVRRLRSAILTPCGQGLRSFRLHYAHSARNPQDSRAVLRTTAVFAPRTINHSRNCQAQVISPSFGL